MLQQPRSRLKLKTARKCIRAMMLAGICPLPVLCTGALSPGTATLQPGPVYTSADGKSFPEFPTIKIVVTINGTDQTLPKSSELSLVEDGVAGGNATNVQTFESTKYGLAAVVAVDVSGSMAGKPLNIIRQSLSKFVSEARSQDSVGVVTIADDAAWDVPFGTDQAAMKTRLQAMHTRGTMTRLFDGLMTALGEFNGSTPARRELTVISDGHDEGSKAHLEDVIRMARGRGIAIDSVGLTRSSPLYLQTLSKLASETGGSFHQVHSDQELDQLISNGMARLKSTPVATFETRHISGDGKQHKLVVHWKTASDLSGETTFLSPRLSGPQFLRTLRHLPAWGYAVLALICFVLLFAAIAILRRMRRHDPVEDTPYEIPRQPYSPVGPHKQTEFERGTAVPSGSGTHADRPRANSLIAPATPVPAPKTPPAARNNQTRVAGVFDTADGRVARLEVLSGVLSGTEVDVSSGEFWIGAAEGNQLVLSNDATVSSRHAYLLFENPILMLVDNRSTNGTRINGQMLRDSRRPLHDGDQIQIGQTLLRLRSSK